MADQGPPHPGGGVHMSDPTGTGGLGSPLVGGLRWRRVFPGRERELSALRRWLSSLLPHCAARDDVHTVANELASNAIQHTLSGRGAWFAVEVTWDPTAVQVAVADCGGPSEPRVINDPGAERGRGLLMVQGLSIRTGQTGDQRGRLVWAQVRWDDPTLTAHPPPPDPYQAAIRDGEAALARRFAGVPAWFGRCTLAWWAVVGPAGLVSAPTARELAGLLYRLQAAPGTPRSQAATKAEARTSCQRAQPRLGNLVFHGRTSRQVAAIQARRPSAKSTRTVTVEYGERITLTRSGEAEAMLLSVDDLVGLEMTLEILGDATAAGRITESLAALGHGDPGADIATVRQDLARRRVSGL